MIKRDGTTSIGGGVFPAWATGLVAACLVGALVMPVAAQQGRTVRKTPAGAGRTPAAAEPASPPPAGNLTPFEALDNQRLCKELSKLGMVEFLDVVVGKSAIGGGSPTEMYLLAEAKIARALTLADETVRNKMMDEAAQLLDRAITTLAKEKSDAKKLLRCQYRLRLAVLLGLQRPEQAALRVMYLQASPEDKAMVREFASKANSVIDKLLPDMDNLLAEWRSDLEKIATVVSEMEEKKAEAGYRQAWIHFYLGMVLPPGPERTGVLREALAAVAIYAAGEEDTGVKYLSLLLGGMCYRELGEYEKAIRNLKAAKVPAADRNSRGQAEFELARCAIQQASARKDGALFSAAEKAVEAYWKMGTTLRGVENLIHDLRAAILGHYLYSSWAAIETAGSDAAKKRAEDAEKQMLKWLKLHPSQEEQDALADILVRKLRGLKEADYLKQETLNLFFLAMDTKRQAKKDPKLLALAEKLFIIIIDRKDASVTMRSESIWQVALIKNEQGNSGEAAKWFRRFDKEYPKDPKSYLAALNAVITLNQVIADKSAKNEVSPRIRADLVEALTKLLDTYIATHPEVAKYYFDLGFHCEKIAESFRKDSDKKAWMRKAIAGYDRVLSKASETLDARNNSLTLQCDLLDMADKATQKEEASKLVGKLMLYGADLSRETASATGTGAKATKLREYGALIEFRQALIQYEMLDRKKEALTVIDSLADKWPGTSVLRVASRWMVAKLVEEGRTSEAIAKVEDIAKKYPQDKDIVVQMVIQQIRDRINKLRGDASQLDTFKKYCEVYFKFAKQLYDVQKDNYPYQQMYAEALIENGQADQAIPLLSKCKEVDDVRRAKEQKKIQEDIAQKIAAAGIAATNSADILAQVEVFNKILEEKGYKAESFSQTMLLKTAVQRLKEDAEDKVRVEIVANRLKDSWKALEVRMVRNVSVDASNIHGLARALFFQKKYAESLRYYNELVPGIDKNANSKFYFESLVEQFKCMFEVYRGSPANLDKMRTVIRQLRMELGDKLPEELDQIELEITKMVDSRAKGAVKG